MPELARTRDCLILTKGDVLPVAVSGAMALGGWQGGQGVQWTNSTKDDFAVTYSDGLYAGFLLWGSDEASDQFTATTRSQPFYRFATMGVGGWHILTRSFERYTWASRQAGPLVPIVYNPSDRLVFSLRGYWTSEDEWSLSGDPRAPNGFYIGFVSQAPNAANGFYLGIQVSL